MQEHKQYTKKRDLETNAKRYPERRQVRLMKRKIQKGIVIEISSDT